MERESRGHRLQQLRTMFRPETEEQNEAASTRPQSLPPKGSDLSSFGMNLIDGTGGNERAETFFKNQNRAVAIECIERAAGSKNGQASSTIWNMAWSSLSLSIDSTCALATCEAVESGGEEKHGDLGNSRAVLEIAAERHIEISVGGKFDQVKPAVAGADLILRPDGLRHNFCSNQIAFATSFFEGIGIS